jgi:hypothetical protein
MISPSHKSAEVAISMVKRFKWQSHENKKAENQLLGSNVA